MGEISDVMSRREGGIEERNGNSLAEALALNPGISRNLSLCERRLSSVTVRVPLFSSVSHETKIVSQTSCPKDTAHKKLGRTNFQKSKETNVAPTAQCSSPLCNSRDISFRAFLITRSRVIFELGIVHPYLDARMECRVWRKSPPTPKMGPINNY